MPAAIALTCMSLMGSAIADEGLDTQPLDLKIEGTALTPFVVADPARDRFLLSWQERLPEGCARLRVATLSKSGVLGEPRDAARGCDWFINWADHPRVAVADNGGWWVYWLQREGDGTYDYGIRVAHSQDEGRTWSAPITPHDDGTRSEHGFVALSPDGGDRMRLVWLDGRRAAAAKHDVSGTGADAHAEHEGDMTLRGAVIDAKGQLSENIEIDARTCSCCWTSLARGDDGRHLAVYRDRSDQEIRDIAFARHDTSGWHVDGLVHADNWKIRACPVNGPGVAMQGDTTLVAWATMPTSSDMAVKVARLGHEGVPVRIEQGPGVLGRVDVGAFDRGFLLSWLGGGKGNDSTLRLASLDAELRERARIDVTTLPAGRGVGVPRLASLKDVGVLVWTTVQPGTSGDAARVTKIAASLVRPTKVRSDAQRASDQESP